MPFGFVKRRARPPAVPDPVALTPVEGSQPCSERACANRSAVACVYVDSHSHPCPTAWCPTHGQVVMGRSYCRRHAGVVRGMTAEVAAGDDLPDLNNRAPSLVEWVWNSVEDDIALVMREHAVAGEQAAAEPLRLSRAEDGDRRWNRAYTAFDEHQVILRVTVEVEERTDTTVSVRANGAVLFREEPPWIGSRRGGGSRAAELDRNQRREFHNRLVAAARQGIVDERARLAGGHSAGQRRDDPDC